MNIYVGNLGYEVTSQELRELFSAHGEVSSANIIMDKFTERSKGFGFVEMDDDAQAQAAIKALDGSIHSGRNMKINEARPRANSSSRSR